MAQVTCGLEWLSHSMAAFNGSGFADRRSSADFLLSYIHYKMWKKKVYGVGLCYQHKDEAMALAKHLISCAEPGRTPSKDRLDKFERFRAKPALHLSLFYLNQ